ncbi:MAG: dihydrodipicolinate synthase family protein [Kurthia sp.]|nr:dihydrodipicolinate synthase family protein [Candidatus Kurthia equi]
MKGIIPPVVTLVDQQGNIDFEKNRKMLDFLIEKGVHGILLLGSSGEFSHFSLEEKKAYLETIIPYINNRVPVLVGTGGTVIEEVIHLSKFVHELGAQGVLVVNPYYWTLSEEQLTEYFSTIANSIDLDVYLYNIPQLTGQEIPVSVVKKLAHAHANIRGIKETVPNMARIRSMITEVAQSAENFHVYSAFDEQLLDAQLEGASGSINGSSVFLPEISVALYHAIQQKDFDEIKQRHLQLTQLMEFYTWHTSFYLTMKEGIHARLFKGESVGYRIPFINNEQNLTVKINDLIERVYVQGGVL